MWLGSAGARAIADVDATLAAVSWFDGGSPVTVGTGVGGVAVAPVVGLPLESASALAVVAGESPLVSPPTAGDKMRGGS